MKESKCGGIIAYESCPSTISLMLATSEDISLMLKSSDNRWRERMAQGRLTYDLRHLSKVWRQLIEELWTDSYRAAIAEMSGLELKDCVMDIGFRRL
ncbi:hypothetical protein [Nostoc sp. ChiQUE01b]|uniref:hypothetical protein n=1 Tax=Nostoc sp. ChiQUE01b TaxID=3075376 RepID=UPI002AD3CA29|nr:hypothetical protein [Nostoc sp. ChiQUE01b]MDZ8264079.1 hypothetical protein [Nostoc sp. ChiQUE01b]